MRGSTGRPAVRWNSAHPVLQMFRRGSTAYLSFFHVCGRDTDDGLKYCEPACRNRDWQFHKRECLADLPAERGPPVTESNVNKTSFWGMEPATDIINIEKNEGIGYQGELRLLLTGCM